MKHVQHGFFSLKPFALVKLPFVVVLVHSKSPILHRGTISQLGFRSTGMA